MRRESWVVRRKGAWWGLALLLTPAVVDAQAPAYRRSTRDTLRYHEVHESRTTIEMQERVSFTTHHDATIALVSRSADTLWAWFEALAISLSAAGGTQRPSTDPVRGVPFVISLSAGGHVVTLQSPDIPDEVAAQTDLSHQFDDFFISLPRTRLRPGVSWTDSLTHDRPGRPNDTYLSERVRRYRVLRDTTAAGEPAVVISVEQTISSESTTPMQGGATAGTVLQGTERGTAVFGLRSGRMLERRRSGVLEGRFSVLVPRQSRVFPERFEYSSTITLQR